MRLVALCSILIPLANAYPLGNPLRILRVVELAQSDRSRIAPLRSPFPAFLPAGSDSTAQAHSSLSGDGAPSPSISPGDFATSFVTTLLGGGLALYFT